MAHTSRKTYERNGVERKVGNDGILRLNDKHIQQELDHIKLL